jgi:hypothetical protein
LTGGRQAESGDEERKEDERGGAADRAHRGGALEKKEKEKVVGGDAWDRKDEEGSVWDGKAVRAFPVDRCDFIAELVSTRIRTCTVLQETQDGAVAIPVIVSEMQRWLPVLGWGPWLIPGVDGSGTDLEVALDVSRAHRVAAAAGINAPPASACDRDSASAGRTDAVTQLEAMCNWEVGTLADPHAWRWALAPKSDASTDHALSPPWEYGVAFFGNAACTLDPVCDATRSREGASVRIRRWVRWATVVLR